MASIQKKNNKYCVVYYCKDTVGKRKQKWEPYDTKNSAIIRNAEIELKEKNILPIIGKTPLTDINTRF